MDERRRLQFAAWSAFVGVGAAIIAVALWSADDVVEGTVFAVAALVFLFVAVAGFLGRWPLRSPADR